MVPASQDPNPQPIAGLLPPSELADDDSKFITVSVRGEEETLHYKEITELAIESNLLSPFACIANLRGDHYLPKREKQLMIG